MGLEVVGDAPDGLTYLPPSSPNDRGVGPGEL